ncbi:uncharacterized protein BKA78DRAFT_298012 [Phyllosticta capitalensis]|uniref:uncharacterized protein n=1 Tax=Phyllosticta capitalensis TaxID=121624 RepID=UPI00312D784B
MASRAYFLICILAFFAFHASTLHIGHEHNHQVIRQTSSAVDNYPCWVCQIDNNESPDLGGSACSESPDDGPNCNAIGKSSFSLNPSTTASTFDSETTKDASPWDIDGERYWISFEPYPGCSDAADGPAAKWFGYSTAGDPSQCPLQVEQLGQDDVDTTKYQSDHVFEAQTLLHFFQWLRGDYQLVAWPESYQHASTDWVIGLLMGNEDGDLDLEPFIINGDTVWDHARAELGSYQYPSRLALVFDSINGKKGVFFQGKRPGAFPRGEKRIDRVKIWQRNVAGVFQYMSDDTVWGILQETSQALEDLFGQFDVQYDWADEGALGRPDREEGQPPAGLRDLFCYFIDARLHHMEERGVDWALSAIETFKTKVVENPDNPDEKDEWLGEFVTGILSADKFQFPQIEPEVDEKGVIKHSPYGMWDNGPIGPF